MPAVTDSKQTGKRACETHPAMRDRVRPQASVRGSGQHVIDISRVKEATVKMQLACQVTRYSKSTGCLPA